MKVKDDRVKIIDSLVSLIEVKLEPYFPFLDLLTSKDREREKILQEEYLNDATKYKICTSGRQEGFTEDSINLFE